MLVQYTPVSALPPDIKEQLRRYLVGVPMLMSSEPIFFAGYHIRAEEARMLQEQAKRGPGQALFG